MNSYQVKSLYIEDAEGSDISLYNETENKIKEVDGKLKLLKDKKKDKDIVEKVPVEEIEVSTATTIIK